MVWDRLVEFMGGLRFPQAEAFSLLRTLVIASAATSYDDLVYDSEDEDEIRRSREIFKDALLSMPIPLQRVVFVPPKRNSNDRSTFNEDERGRVRMAFPRLEARGITHFERL